MMQQTPVVVDPTKPVGRHEQGAANLLDAAESDIRPRETLEIGRFTQVTATSRKEANLEHWRWFALAALAVMLGEWWWFHRRTA